MRGQFAEVLVHDQQEPHGEGAVEESCSLHGAQEVETEVGSCTGSSAPEVTPQVPTATDPGFHFLTAVNSAVDEPSPRGRTPITFSLLQSFTCEHTRLRKHLA